ncbi:MAG: hypothetical protein A2Z08_00935 [Deltaproteobacteria bacterium RBG_16_54_11]|nr:MAG: hypothetical protein A2Z08_00935 [Deltaproteobacteria bacterium RBG_16_54_11]
MCRIMRFCIRIGFILVLMSCALTERGWVKELQENVISLSQMVESTDPQTLNYKMVIHDMGRTEYVPGESRRPNPGFIFMIAEINLKQKKLTIEKNDICLIDTSGTKWYGYFFTPVIYPIVTWAGIRVQASKSKLKITSEGIPDIRSDRIVAVTKGSHDTVIIEKTNTGGLFAIDVIKMLFEVPESKVNDLKLMFRNKVVAQISAKRATEGEQQDITADKTSQEQTQQKEASKDSGIVSIVTDPPGAKIFIDGEFKGQTPAEISLAIGAHQLFLQRQLYDPYKESVGIEKGQTKTLNIKLSPEGKE